MLHWAGLWVISAVLFLLIDMVWLLWLGRSIYVSEIGVLLRQPPNFAAAAAFYLLYVSILMIMVIWPASKSQSVVQALTYGALLGLVAYGTYDLTNLAVMKGFTTRIALIDLAWGTALTAFVSAATVALSIRLWAT